MVKTILNGRNGVVRLPIGGHNVRQRSEMTLRTWVKIGAGIYGGLTWLVIWGLGVLLQRWPRWLDTIFMVIIILASDWVLRWAPYHSVAHDFWAVGFIIMTLSFIFLT